jgi:hypothetical protein
VIGASLAHYRVTAALGAGGMGEVYRATDTKLGREVAIKVLPAEVAQGPERLARFEREAKLLASLNHSNIAHVYGFESATLPDGSAAHFLAMELVPGEDLAERLKRGAIPVDEAIAIAKQIAEALEDVSRGELSHRWPGLVAGAEAVLFTLKTKGLQTFDDAPIAAVSLKNGERTKVIDGGTGLRRRAAPGLRRRCFTSSSTSVGLETVSAISERRTCPKRRRRRWIELLIAFSEVASCSATSP